MKTRIANRCHGARYRRMPWGPRPFKKGLAMMRKLMHRIEDALILSGLRPKRCWCYTPGRGWHQV